MLLPLPGRAPLDLGTPRIVGVLNVTPDSFSDSGRFTEPDDAAEHGLTLARQGAAVIDVGGESTRPGARRIDADEQIDRTAGVIRRLRALLDAHAPDTLISIDTTRAPVAWAALDAGAAILNDVSAGREDPAMLALAAQTGAPLVLMHMQGDPATMQHEPAYADVVAEVQRFLLERLAAAVDAGVDRARVVLDPGIGFGKTVEHNLALLAALPRLVALGQPVLVGASRKRFIAAVSPATGKDPANRLGGTAAVTAWAVAAGVRLIRVHDVPQNVQAAEVAHAIATRRSFAAPPTLP